MHQQTSTSGRNQATAGAAVADAIRIGHKPLAEANEYFQDLNDKDLLSLIVQVTGAQADSQVAKLTLSTIKNLKTFADFESKNSRGVESPMAKPPAPSETPSGEFRNPEPERRTALNLSYTINLNLPATADQAVFNAIFRSLKEQPLGRFQSSRRDSRLLGVLGACRRGDVMRYLLASQHTTRHLPRRRAADALG